jgi:Ran GTPase-activating protein (RanGAP) involved in mRNA processing and transport
VLSIVARFRQHTRALTFENLCQTRMKLAVMAKMMKGSLATAFQTWRENTMATGVYRKLTLQEARDEKERMLEEFKNLVTVMLGYDGEWYNDDTHYKDAMTWSLDTKAGIIRKYREIRSERFRRLEPDAKQRILNSKCILWAREGTVYQIISNTKRFPWHAVAQGEVSDVMLRPDLNDAQANLAWEAIEANYKKYHLGGEGDFEGNQAEHVGQHVEHVSLRGLLGKIVKLEVGQTLMGSTLSMEVEKIGLDGVMRKEVQGLGPESIRLLLPALRRNQSLTKLDLSRSVVGPELARELAVILRRMNGKNFSSLHIRGNIPLGRARNDMELTLSRNTHITTYPNLLERTHTGSVNGMSVHGPTVPGMSMHGPSVHGNEESERSQSSLAASSRSMRSNTYNGFGRDWEPCNVEGGIAIATFLQDNRGLHKLDLEGNCIGPEGARALANVLTLLTGLTLLNIRDNNIGTEGAASMSSAIQKHGSLVELDLRDNRMGALGLASLVPAIQASTCLVKLNDLQIETAGVCANSMQVRNMTDPGYEMVFVHLRLRTQARDITFLDLADNGLGFEGARLLRAVLLDCKNLEELDVRSNHLRSAGVVLISDAFPELRKLRWLDLSYNLVNTLDSNIEVASVLTKLVQLKELVFLGNIKTEIGVAMCCPVSYGGSYAVLKMAVPQTKITSMTTTQARNGILTFFTMILLIALWIVLSATAIFLYNTLSYNELGYAKTVGSLAVVCLVALFLFIWVLYRRMFSNLGITHLLATFMYRHKQRALAQPLAQGDARARRRSSHITYSDLESGEGGLDVFCDDLLPAGLSEDERQLARRIFEETASGPTDRLQSMRTLSMRVESMRHLLANGSYAQEDDKAAAEVEPDEDFEFAMKLDPKIARKVPMLLEQYILRTAVPGSVDMDMRREHARMMREFDVHSFFHSSSPLTLALRKPLVQALLFLIVVYYVVISVLMLVPWYMEEEVIPLTSYRLVCECMFV